MSPRASGSARAALVLAALLALAALAPERSTPPGVVPTDLRGPAELLFAGRIDPNRADRDTLEALPGIGPGRAAAWVEERARRPFCRAADLDRVQGIGPRIRQGLEELLFFERDDSCGAIPVRPIDL